MQHLSTRHLPPGVAERDRLAFVHDVVGRHAAGMRFAPCERDAFDADFAILTLPGGALVSEAAYGAFAGSRTPELLNDGRDGYQLMIPDVDFETEIDGGRTVTVRAGDLLVLDQAVAFACRLPPVRLEVVALPRAGLSPRVRGLGAEPFRIVPREAPGLALFARYAALLREGALPAGLPSGAAPAGSALARLAEAHLHELAIAVVGGRAEAAQAPLAAARLELVKKEMRLRLAEPGLSIAQVARRQKVSPRYIQRLFAAEGTSFSDHLRALRLEDARARLDAAAPQTIADIAFAAGFGDVSSFNRAFRRRYGLTPSQVRAEALRRR